MENLGLKVFSKSNAVGKYIGRLDDFEVYLNHSEYGPYIRTAYGNSDLNAKKNYTVPVCFNLEKMDVLMCRKIVDFRLKHNATKNADNEVK